MDDDDIYWDSESNWDMTSFGVPQPRLDCFYPCVPSDQAIIPNLTLDDIAYVDLVDIHINSFTIRENVIFDNGYGVPAYLSVTSLTFVGFTYPNPSFPAALEAIFAEGAQCVVSTIQGPY